MKILVSITMSFLFLFQGMAANMEVCEQMENISDFVAHYQEHKSFDDDSLFDFVYEDYIADTHNTDGHHQDSEHDEAPVHNGHQCCQHFVFFAPFQSILMSTVINEEQNQFNYYTLQLNSRYLETLFQPPKF